MMPSCDEMNEQLSGYLDHELTQQESQKVEHHLRSCRECSELLEQLKQVSRDVRGSAPMPTLDQKQWDRMQSDALSRGMETTGWSLLLLYVGCIAGLAVFASITFLGDPEIPLIAKILGALAFLGFGLLFGAVLRQRLLVFKTDKYRKVKF